MKYRYALDENNQLLIKPENAPRFLPAPGKLSLEKGSRLVYWLDKPATWKTCQLGPKISFSGTWQLDRDHNFELVLEETAAQSSPDRLTVQGRIVSFEGDTIAFEVRSTRQAGICTIQLFKFAVTWLADDDNRLNFIIKKQSPDIITLESAWKLNRRQQIVYSYKKEALKRKTATTQELAFDGYWELGQSDKLVYKLSGSSDSRFGFYAQAESVSMYPRQGAIKYRLGAGVEQTPKKGRCLVLYGTWKFGRRRQIGFEMEYGRGRFVRTEFLAELTGVTGASLEVRLTGTNGEPTGITVKLTRRLLKAMDGEAFLRLKKNLVESAVEAGVKIPF